MSEVRSGLISEVCFFVSLVSLRHCSKFVATDWKTLGFYLQQLRVCPKHQCISTVAVRRDLYPRNPDQVLITDFFGSVRNVEMTDNYINLDGVEISNGTCRWGLCSFYVPVFVSSYLCILWRTRTISRRFYRWRTCAQCTQDFAFWAFNFELWHSLFHMPASLSAVTE